MIIEFNIKYRSKIYHNYYYQHIVKWDFINVNNTQHQILTIPIIYFSKKLRNKYEKFTFLDTFSFLKNEIKIFVRGRLNKR